MFSFRSRLSARIAFSLVIAPVLLGAIAAPVAATSGIVMAARLGDCQFTGINAGSLKTVQIEWRDVNHDLKSKQSVKSTSDGRFTTKCEIREEIEPGDYLSARVGTGPFFTLGVPNIRGSIDRDADTVLVRYDWNSTVNIDLYTLGGTFDSVTLTTDSVTIPPLGWTTESFPGVDITGYDFADLSWTDPRGDLFVRTVQAPGFTAWLGRPFMTAVGTAGTLLDARITDIGNTVTYARSGGTMWEGTNAFYLYDDEGQRRNSIVGDRVAVMLGDTAASVITPSITANISKSQDTVDAYCNSSGVGVEVVVYARDGSLLQYRTGFESQTLAPFHANFAPAPKHNIISGDKVDVYCRFSTGDIVARRFTVL